MIKCIRGHIIEILKSDCGYYVGTLDPKNGIPYCRISDYEKEQQLIEHFNVYRMANASENIHCNGACHCVTGEPFIEILKRC